MPDITMCEGVNSSGATCPKRERCFRHTAEPCRQAQSFFVEAPFKADGTCRHYLAPYDELIAEDSAESDEPLVDGENQ